MLKSENALDCKLRLPYGIGGDVRRHVSPSGQTTLLA